MHSIVDYLEKWVAEIPEQPLYTFLDGGQQILESYTYRRLHERSNSLAAALQTTSRLPAGSPVLLIYPPGLEVIVAFFACVKLGVIPVPIPPPDATGLLGGMEKCASIAHNAGAVAVLTTQVYRQQLHTLLQRNPEATAALQAAPLRDLPWVETDTFQGELEHFDRHDHAVLFLQYTSGSTQQPRGVIVSHDNIIQNGHATLDHRPVGVSWLPHYHDMGLIGYYLFIMLTGGQAVSFSALHFLKRPLLWLETISRVGATITSAPNFAFEYCLREDKVPASQLPSLNLSSLRCLMNASEPVRSSTYTRFLAKFAPCGLSPQASVVFYGLAENTLSVTGHGRTLLTVNTNLLEQHVLRLESPRPDGYNQRQIVSCGRPLHGVTVKIVDPATSLGVGEGRLGEIWLHGSSKTAGYWNNPALTQQVFQAVLQDDPSNTYLRTGDIGFLHEGELFVCGRLKDMIIMGGRNYYPTDIEAVVERCSRKIRPGCVAAFAIDGEAGEAIVVLAEVLKANDLPDVEALCQDIRQHCQVDVALFALVPHGTVVKTSSGKIARQLCKQRWQAGTITPLLCRQHETSATADTTLAHLLKRFSMPGYEECTLAELGVDSLTLVQLSLYIEGVCKAQGLLPDPAAAAQLFDLRVLQTVTVGEIQALLSLGTDQELLARQADATQEPVLTPSEIQQAYQERVQAIEQAEYQRMRHDTVLPVDIAPPGQTVAGGNTVVLTGATGFLGAFLLEALLRLTDYDVVTMVRASDAAHAQARTMAALQRTGLWNEALHDAFSARVTALQGDIAQPRLGLSPGQWDTLAQEATALYHCGAEVDYVQPYASLHAANVGGTLEILRLASSGARKVVHFASTTFIFGFCPRHILWESDRNTEMAGLNFGYAQSKWVAEQLVYAAAQRGMPVQVYRPSLITASRHGRYVRRDIMARILAYMIRHGIATDAVNQVSLLPVDVCAQNLVALSLLDAPPAQTFHFTANEYYTMEAVCAQITHEFGYTFRYTSLDGFIEHMNAHCTQDDPLFPLMAFLNHNVGRLHAMRHKRYDNQHYRLAQTKASWTLPEPPLEDTVRSIVAFLQQENLVPAPPRGRRITWPVVSAKVA